MEEKDDTSVEVPHAKLGIWSVALAVLFGVGFWVSLPRIGGLSGSLTGPQKWLLASVHLGVPVAMCVLGLALAKVGLSTHGGSRHCCKLGFWLNAILLTPISLLAFAFLARGRPTYAIAPDERFSGVTEVHFEMRYLDKFEDGPGRDMEFTIDDPHEVRRLTQEVRLRPKEECKCGEHSRACFIKGGEVIEVSFCDHCFDIEKPDGTYEYNAGYHVFYQLVQEYEGRERLKRGQGASEVPPPPLQACRLLLRLCRRLACLASADPRGLESWTASTLEDRARYGTG